MITIQIMDRFIFHQRKDQQNVDWYNLVLWLVGFLIYRWLMTIDLPVGNTLPDVIIVMIIAWLFHMFERKTE